MSYALSHLSDQILLRDLATLVARDRTHTAALIAHLGEVEGRRLYLPAAHPSMFSYCVSVLHLSEQATYKRIRVSRMARKFPAIYGALAEGRVHLSGLVLLKPFMSRRTVAELLAAAAHKSTSEIKKLLAERFPKADVPTRVRALPQSRANASEESGGPSLLSIAENLLENACKYSPLGSTVKLELLADPGRIELQVHDEGGGVPEAERTLIFRKFHRGGHEETRGTKGTGLGLYIVHRLATMLGGNIEHRHRVPRGSIFVATFPAT